MAFAAAGATAALTLTGGIADISALTATIGLVVGLAWSLTGLEEWRSRPTRRIGPLMVFLGFAWFASQLVYADVSRSTQQEILFGPSSSPCSGTCCSRFRAGASRVGSHARSSSRPIWTRSL
jgi:hypothetical protein